MSKFLSTRSVPGLQSCLILLALLFFSPLSARALDVPALKGRVNDYAGILSPATISQLETSLANFEAAESTQIVLLTIPSLEGDSLEAFSLRVAETWRPGQKKLDNGALLLIASQDRKLRIEVGYGLEGRLTDLSSGRIIRNIITPRFKEGNFDQGVIDGINAMMATVKGEFTPPAEQKGRQRLGINPAGLFIFLIIVIFSVLGRMLSRVPIVSAIVGAILAPAIGAFFLSAGLFILVILAILGFIFGLIAARTGGSGGGFGSGYYPGGFGGGFSGGFSGGGGGFGGGGASGSW